MECYSNLLTPGAPAMGDKPRRNLRGYSSLSKRLLGL